MEREVQSLKAKVRKFETKSEDLKRGENEKEVEKIAGGNTLVKAHVQQLNNVIGEYCSVTLKTNLFWTSSFLVSFNLLGYHLHTRTFPQRFWGSHSKLSC